MAKVQPLLSCAVSSLLVFGVVASSVAAPGDEITLTDPALSDSGGLAADPIRSVYWTAAESGVVEAISPDGSTAGEVHYAATPTDVEALAMHDGALYIGDIGGSRSSVNIYRLDSMDYGSTADFTEWTLHYPDGPHEAMTMMVSPRGNLWIVTMGSPGLLYYIQAPVNGGELTMEYVGEGPDWITDGVFVDGSTAALRTYTSVLTYDMMDYEVTAAEAAPKQPQGESITTALDDRGFVLGSRDDDRLLEVAVPTVMENLAPAPSRPPGTGSDTSDTDSAEEGTAAGEEASGGNSSATTPAGSTAPRSGGRGTIRAISIAALVSVVSGGFVYLASKPRPGSYRRRH